MVDGDVAAVLITGGLASGKTTVSAAVGELVEAEGVSGCVLDLDWLCWAWSPRLDSVGLHRLLCDNLRVVAPRLLAEGLSRLVLCRTLLETAHIDDIRDAVDVPMQVVRLSVSRQEAERRVRRRDAGEELDTHLSELDRFAVAAERAALGAPVVDTTGRAAEHVAAELLSLIGWSVAR